MLTEQQRKYLTELIGDCWHEWYGEPGYNCIKCHKLSMNGCLNNRTFTEPADFFAVCRVMDWKDVERALCYMDDKANPAGDVLDGIVKLMQQPTFIEDFMREVAKMGGIE